VNGQKLLRLSRFLFSAAGHSVMQKISIVIIYDARDPFSFSAPPFTGPRRHAIIMYALIDRHAHPQHSRSALLRCAVLVCWFDNGLLRMLARAPVHGMQGLFGKAEE
jgi:hypothetical protein